MKIVSSVITNFLDFLPLLVFLQVAERSAAAGTTNWLFAFKISGIVAVFHVIWLISRKRIASRVALAMDLYFLSGGMASVLSLDAVMAVVKNFRESGVLVMVCAVGVVTTFFSPNGFIGCGESTPGMFVHSLYLLAVTFAATLVSFVCSGEPLLAGVLPVLSIVVTNKILLRRLRTAAQAG